VRKTAPQVGIGPEKRHQMKFKDDDVDRISALAWKHPWVHKRTRDVDGGAAAVLDVSQCAARTALH